MVIEGVEIKDYKYMDGILMLNMYSLEDFAQKCIELGKVKKSLEDEYQVTILKGKELSDYLKVSYSTIRKWRKKGHPKFEAKFEDGFALRMTLQNAEELRNQILGI